MDLANATVYLDFDGTISRRDIGVVLLEQAGTPEWRDLDDQYARGEIGSRECMVRQFGMLRGDPDELLAIARSVPLDPGALPLIRALQDVGADVAVVSDGFGFYVEPLLRDAGISLPVLTNAVDWTARAMQFPNEDRCCPCSTCGTCKQAPIRDAQAQQRTTIFVGDGISDRKAALLADVLYATGHLADWCDDAGVPYTPFWELDDVARSLLGMSVLGDGR
jgi:2,3-diketo-5-methylthio-1-phosphopentane phosphatase